MKNLVEYIKESLGNAYNDNSSLAEYLIIHLDYEYIVKPLLNSAFDNVVQLNSSNDYDFTCSNDDFPKIGIYYKSINRDKEEINIEPELLNNGKINLYKKGYKSYLAYIYQDNLCLIDIKEFNHKLDLTKAEPELKYELSDNMKSLYNDTYSLYDSLSPDIKKSNEFKKFDEFKQFEEILNK